MRILQIGKYYHPYKGGIETLVKDLSEKLIQEGFETTVIVFNDKNKTEISILNGIKVIRCSTLFKIASQPISLSYCLMIFKLIKLNDLVHLHLPNILSMLTIFFIPKRKINLIVHWHSDIVSQVVLNKLLMPFQKSVLKKAKAVVVTSPQYYKGSTPLKTCIEKLLVIPNSFKNNTNNEYEKNDDILQINKKIVLSVGRLVEYKGFKYLIRAAKLLPDNYIVYIAGFGPLSYALKKEIIDNNLQTKVKLLGRVTSDELVEYYKACSVFVLPSISRAEAFGIVMIEAMSFSKPVVATNIENSGVNWVNEHNVTGLNVAIENEQELAEAILKITCDPILNQKYSSNAYSKANTFFSIDIVAQQIKNLYMKFQK